MWWRRGDSCGEFEPLQVGLFWRQTDPLSSLQFPCSNEEVPRDSVSPALRQESRPSRTLGALSASCSENTRAAILYRVGTLPAQVHAGGVRPLSDAWSV